MAEDSTFNLDLDQPTEADLEATLQADAAAAGIDPDLLQAVDVWSEPLEGRQRKIAAKIQIPRSLDHVWQVLTDYEALATFIPNLAKSQRLPHPTGGIRLEQVGTQRLMRVSFSARVVLDLTEVYPSEIRFEMVEGDFKSFTGTWQLEAIANASSQPLTQLSYTVCVWPKRTMPVILIENRLRHDLPLNLIAVRQRVETLFAN